MPEQTLRQAPDRITSSVITPPALRMMCASPLPSPSSSNVSIRESMTRHRGCRVGATCRSASWKSVAYVAFFATNWSALGEKPSS